jgi:hypothetical protein
MDIPKYIGLFLVKNKYCSLPGLGTLELIRKGASYSNDGPNVEPPKYDIKFSNLSSIDDQFPNFIGVQENISSNNATNAISTFSKKVKQATQNGNPFVLDGIGRFVQNNGTLSFQPVSEFDAGEFSVAPPPISPMDADNTRVVNNTDAEASKDFGGYGYTAEPKQSINWGKMIIPLALLAALAAAVYFGYGYMQKKNAENVAGTLADSSNVEASVVINTDSLLQDSLSQVAFRDSTLRADSIAKATPAAPKDTTKAKTDTVAAKPAFKGPAMKIVARSYTTQASADLYAKKLKSFGRESSVRMLDSTNYQVIINLPETTKPAAETIDEIRKFYNPSEQYGKVQEVK